MTKVCSFNNSLLLGVFEPDETGEDVPTRDMLLSLLLYQTRRAKVWGGERERRREREEEEERERRRRRERGFLPFLSFQIMCSMLERTYSFITSLSDDLLVSSRLLYLIYSLHHSLFDTKYEVSWTLLLLLLLLYFDIRFLMLRYHYSTSWRVFILKY